MPQNTSNDSAVRRASSSSEEERAHTQQRFRRLPSVEWLRRRAIMGQAGEEEGQKPDPRLTHIAREILDSARTAIRRGEMASTREELVMAVRARLAEARAPYLREVINATGVIVHTNLGRAPLSERAIEQVVAVARGYSNLEFDLADGARGSRLAGVRQALPQLTGAEDAVVVNNNAAAVLLTLAALATGREVIVSRGELVEIGGGFRIPEVLEQSGARLVEVGTTNKTHLRDYEMAITPETVAILSVHPSNFRIVGFTETPSLAQISDAAHAAGIHHIHDLGSGALFDTERWGLAHEPTARESLAAGVDIVCFSADKLLGGPQVGVILGRRALLARIERHPLMRAVRSDKLTLAALEATLQQHLAGVAAREIPVARMIATPLESLRARTEVWALALADFGLSVTIEAGESTVGGGSLPGETLPTALCVIAQNEHAPDIAALAARLRQAAPPVVGRVLRDRLLLDPRTVRPDQDDLLLRVIGDST
jgi:L-seryl-tRNA(Ser) seleniumtransferase